MYTVSELIILARAYLAAKPEISVTRLGVRAAGTDRLFHRLFAGHGCSSGSLERASLWFRQNWPAEIPWPQGIPPRKSDC